MTLIRDLVLTLPGTHPGAPRLTWYGAGERVELSGRVLVNGVVKATNLLVAEAELGPGRRLALDLPAHWRALVWALAAWTTGAELDLVPRPPAADDGAPHTGAGPRRSGGPDDVLVTDRPPADGIAHQADVVVAVPLSALALRFPPPLPEGAIDGAADLMTYPDALGWLPPVEPERPALASRGGVPPVTHGDLLTWARSTAGADAWPGAPRVLLVEPTPLELLAHAVVALSVDGSLVLVGTRSEDVAHVARQERVTVPR